MTRVCWATDSFDNSRVNHIAKQKDRLNQINQQEEKKRSYTNKKHHFFKQDLNYYLLNIFLI